MGAVTACILAWVALWAQAPDAATESSACPVPPELRYSIIKPRPLGPPSATLQGSYRTRFKEKTVVLTWKRRSDPAEDWKELRQELVTPYWPVDVAAFSRERVFVTGVTDRGETVIERWELSHPPLSGEENGVEEALGGTLPPPDVKRGEIYRSSRFHVLDLCGDPQERFLLLLTLENRSVYKMDPSSGECEFLFGPSECRQLSECRSLGVAEYEGKGYVYYLTRSPARIPPDAGETWIPLEDGGAAILRESVVFTDSDKDGVIEKASLRYMTPRELFEAGYY